MSTYDAADLNPLAWDELGSVFEALASSVAQQIADHGAFDAIVPILRSGAIPGAMLAVRFRVDVLLPLQFRYVHGPTRLRTVAPLPAGVVLPQGARILVCDCNCSTGDSLASAVRAVKAAYPGARISVAALVRAFGGPERIHGAQAFLHGCVSDERRLAPADHPEVRAAATLFPWENADDELAELNGGAA